MHKIKLDSTPLETNLQSPTEKNEMTQKAVDEKQKSDNNVTSMKTSSKKTKKMVLIFSLVAIAAGVGTGYGSWKLKMKNSGSSSRGPQPSDLQRVAQEGQIKVGDIFGVKDEKTFKDSAQGYLEIGGLDGEGSHKIIRPGGDSQTVYLTSSITDLDKFDGMEVKVWGETFKGQKAGWLMDVGRIEVLQTEGEIPTLE